VGALEKRTRRRRLDDPAKVRADYASSACQTGLLTTERLLETMLFAVVTAAGVGLVLDDALPIGLALVGIAVMIGWWRLKLPPPL